MQSVRACTYIQYKHYHCDFYCCKCAWLHAAVCSVVLSCTCMCARTARVYAKECGSVCGADWECACAFPPAGTIITARAHSRQLSPGGPWLRPAWRDAAWLTVEPGSALLPPTRTQTNIHMYVATVCMIHAYSTSYLYCSHNKTGPCMWTCICAWLYSFLLHMRTYGSLCCTVDKMCFVQGLG